MESFNFKQGSDEWKQFRSEHCPASEFPSVMNVNKYTKRHGLMTERKSEEEKEHSDFTLELFAKGHAAEAAFRPILEKIINEELYPVTGRLEGTLLTASFDGLTMDYSAGFEHKLWNKKLSEQVAKCRETNDPIYLDEHYRTQLDQQLLVSNAAKIYFVTSDGTEDQYEMMEYFPDLNRLSIIENEWKKFMDELEHFDPDNVVELKTVKSTDIIKLPTLMINIEGNVKESNLAVYEETAMRFIDSINKDLVTDEDFANAENMVKFCTSAEEKLSAAKKNALSQTATIESVFESIDTIKEALRQTRLDLSKLVVKRKEELKNQLLTDAEVVMTEFARKINEKLTPYSIRSPLFNFAQSIKGKRNLKSMADAIAEQTAKYKVEIEESSKLIARNSGVIKETMAGFDYLINDAQQLIHMDTYELSQTLKQRLEDEKARLKQVEDDKTADAEERGRIHKESAEKRESELKNDPPASCVTGDDFDDHKVEDTSPSEREANGYYEIEEDIPFAIIDGENVIEMRKVYSTQLKAEIAELIHNHGISLKFSQELSEILKKHQLI